MVSEDDIATFLAITNVDSTDIAKHFIDMSGGNLDTAVSLYFEHGSTITHTNNNNSGDNHTPTNNNDDLALAERLQNEENQRIEQQQDNNSVREPIQVRHETLIDTSETIVFPNVSFGGIGGRFNPLTSISTNHPRSVFNQNRIEILDDDDDDDDDDNDYDDDADDDPIDEYDYNNYDDDDDDDNDHMDEYNNDEDIEFISENYRSRSNHTRYNNNNNDTEYGEDEFDRVHEVEEEEYDNDDYDRPYPIRTNNRHRTHQEKLAMLFRPPFDLIQNITLDEAKLEGRRSNKWIMINIQAVDVFQCQVLNRDLWKDGRVKRLISNNFIFLQYHYDTIIGQNYCQFYGLLNGKDSLPHIAILDSITGERLKQWNTQVPATESFINELDEFLSLNPIPGTAQSEPIEQKSLAVVSGTTSDDDKNIDTNTAFSGTDDSIKKGGGTIEEEEKEEEKQELSVFDLIEAVKRPEPQNTPGVTTRLQIRTSTGRRIVRRFNIEDKVRAIYEYVKADLGEDLNGVRFSLTTPQNKTNLLDMLDKTIGEAGLKNSSLLLEKE
ncbi:related to UBX domain-containing protein 5 [Saccharomycodes ludwigii]|uniref:Related to UBX domain-containing protein 5 n=1 Tax=Saccharomycodes ludwigii TaxID=36035 RepID=A0A376B4D4_9ASCO|nr:hypothetical protein SCDLUD_004734 [Saccharomycodes ludwigii]KAH3899297.1 hypothetical protein SCDLUD_004734 [Saccharomycodes ludwigii]SSD59556.1 related to UBX domain-containing protein 5 [Saccharomycodes ludwigii]